MQACDREAYGSFVREIELFREGTESVFPRRGAECERGSFRDTLIERRGSLGHAGERELHCSEEERYRPHGYLHTNLQL
jgi:hypothetical protein